MRQLFEKRTTSSNILPLFALATFSLNLVTLFLLMFHGSLLSQLKRQAPPRLVQLDDGSAIAVERKEYDERTPNTIRRFVGESMTLMLTWSEKMPPESIWIESQALVSEDFRENFPKKIEESTLSDAFSSNLRNTQTVLIVKRIDQPKEIKDGKWQVDILANFLLVGSSDKLGKAVPFNKRIIVQVVEPPKEPLEVNSSVNRASYRLRAAGLEIAQICELDEKDCS